MAFSGISFAFLMLFIVVAGIEIYRMIHRDILRSMLSGAIVLLSILLSVIFCPIISRELVSMLISPNGFFPELAEEIAELGYLSTLVSALASMILSTVLLILLFFLFRALLAMLFGMICAKALSRKHTEKAFPFEKETWLDRNPKEVKVLIGLLNAFLITALITAPVMGALDVTAQTLDVAESFDEDCWDSPRDTAELVQGFRSLSLDPIGNVFYHACGKFIYSAAATTNLNGNRVYLSHELNCLEEISEDFSAILPVFTNPNNANPSHVAALYRVCDRLEQMELSKPLLAEFVSKAAGAWTRGNLYYSIARPTLNEVIDPAFDEIINVCAGSNIHNAQRNTITLLRIYAILIESGLLEMQQLDTNFLLSFMENTDIIDRLCYELEQNPDMLGISQRISSIALGAMALKINQLNMDVEDYDELLTNLADAVESVRSIDDPEERIKQFNDYTKYFLEEYQVEMPEMVTQYASEQLLDMLMQSGGTIDASKIEELLSNFAF